MDIDEGGNEAKVMGILEEYQSKVEEYKQEAAKSSLLIKQLQRENEQSCQ